MNLLNQCFDFHLIQWAKSNDLLLKGFLVATKS